MMAGFDDPEGDDFTFPEEEPVVLGCEDEDHWDHFLPDEASHEEHCALFLPERQDEVDPTAGAADSVADHNDFDGLLPVRAELRQWSKRVSLQLFPTPAWSGRMPILFFRQTRNPQGLIGHLLLQ